MMWREITEKDKKNFNDLAEHPLQAYEWGEFREKTGVKVIRWGKFDDTKLIKAFQITLHPVPHTSFFIGYLAKSYLPDQETLSELYKLGKQYNCVFIQIEPLVAKQPEFQISNFKFQIRPSAHPLFPTHTMVLDLTSSEETLLANMHPKTRYNIKVAQKHGVEIIEDNSEKAFDTYWDLLSETTQRQHFFAHSKTYHKKQWDTLNVAEHPTQDLTSHLLLGKHDDKTIVSWLLFVFKHKLYYPYGGSTREHKELMAPNLMMWEAIRFGKTHNLTEFDMWGSLGPDADPKDPWFGFHQFKLRYGAQIKTFMGSFDLVVNPFWYTIYRLVDRIRFLLIK